ncbi:hypothetical protein [Hahella ganghwensis]|uniref:hypothetical protein n=1 Tax=Hahella ganghwensis TaxID=286420 RepID=UPI0003A14626|nr:hypothetical protein [Hahella ganghwensis]
MLHIAGNLKKQVQGKWGQVNKSGPQARNIDEEANFSNIGGNLSRRFSITSKDEADYVPGRAAFIIGIRASQGEWRFYTQVFKDMEMASFDDKLVEIFVPRKPILQ